MKMTPLASHGPQPSAKLPSYSLLYVEDEDENWEVAELSLRDRYKLTRARTSREAFALLKKDSFDAVLMDIQLSGSDLDGIEITQALRGKPGKSARPPYAVLDKPLDVPIIFVTAYNARYTKEELVQVGGDDMIPKPVDFTRLALAITRLVLKRMNVASAARR